MGEFIDWLLSLTGQVEDWILMVADAWWIHLVVYGLSALDGFFPTAPSESTIVSLSSLWSSSGRPHLLLLGLAAWLGAWTGDNIGYWIGSTIGWERFRFLREGKGRAAVDAADRGLQRRALLFLMTARYIPFGRTAVNLVAGAVHFPHAKFWPRSLLSTFVWAVYSCAIGVVAGAWLGDHHLVGIVVALIAAIALALIAERGISAVHRVLDRRAEARGEVVPDRDEEDGMVPNPDGPAQASQDSSPGGDTGPAGAGPPDRTDAAAPRAARARVGPQPESTTARDASEPTSAGAASEPIPAPERPETEPRDPEPIAAHGQDSPA